MWPSSSKKGPELSTGEGNEIEVTKYPPVNHSKSRAYHLSSFPLTGNLLHQIRIIIHPGCRQSLNVQTKDFEK